MPFFIPFLVTAAFVAAGVGANRIEKKSQREIEEADTRRIGAERAEKESRERAVRLAGETSVADERRREAQARERAAAEAARKEEERKQAAIRATLEAKRKAEEADLALVRGIPPQERPSLSDINRVRMRYSYQSSMFNVAIVGESGMGKSTLLNSVRGLLSTDYGAAKPGFNEATITVQWYSDRYHEYIRWYDVPGANTPTINGWRYFSQQGLFIFDALIIVFCDRFTQTIGTIISNAEACGIPVFLVRTKADQLIQNIQDDSYPKISEAQARQICLKDTQTMVSANLNRINLPSRKSYLVSRRAMRDYVVYRDRRRVLSEGALMDEIVSLARKTKDIRRPLERPTRMGWQSYGDTWTVAIEFAFQIHWHHIVVIYALFALFALLISMYPLQ